MDPESSRVSITYVSRRARAINMTQLANHTLVHFYRESRYPQVTASEMPSPSPDRRVARLNPPVGPSINASDDPESMGPQIARISRNEFLTCG